jgi:hypothetical protein
MKSAALVVWRIGFIAFLLLTAACSRKSERPAPGPFKPSPTLTRHVTFVQWTDPHVFDAGKGRPAEGVREEELDNWAAFHWAVLETNRLALAEHRDINFVVITGDFGLENVQLPSIDGTPEKDRDCSNRKPGEDGPIARVQLAEAAAAVARELDALLVKRVYLVPGNNDLCHEDPRDLRRWAEFVFALQQRLEVLAKTRSQSSTNSTNKANKSDGPKDVELFDLSDSLAQLYDKDPRVTALFSKDSPPEHLEPQIINGIHLLGLNSAFFKDHEKDEDTTLQPEANTAISKEIDRIDGNIQPGSVYLVFTHIPDLQDPFPQPDGKLKSSWKFHDEKTLPGKTTTHDKWINILKKPEVLGVFAGHFHISDRALYPHGFANLKPDDTTAAKFWLAPPLAEKYQFRSPPDKTARGMLLVSVNADGDTRVPSEEGEIVQPSAIWYSTADQKTATTGDEKLAQARAEDLDHEWEKAAAGYGKVLTDPSLDARTRTTALSGYWHAHEMTSKWWWQSRVARWLYLDGLPVLWSILLALPLLVAVMVIGLLLYEIYSGLKWLLAQRYKFSAWVFRVLVPFHGRALIVSTIQLTADAPDKEFAARLRAEGEEIKRLLLDEKESWAAGHITLLTPAGSSFDQLVGSIPKVESVALSDWFRFLVNVLQTFRWTVQSGIAVFPPNQHTVPPLAAGSDKIVPGSEVAAYAVLQWAWIVRNSWHFKFKVTNDRTALCDLARELAELILGEAFV